MTDGALVADSGGEKGSGIELVTEGTRENARLW